MAKVVAAALDALKAGNHPSGLLAQWVEWLWEDVLESLGEPARLTLRRLVITAGWWLVSGNPPTWAPG
jgi:hypothetical protein